MKPDTKAEGLYSNWARRLAIVVAIPLFLVLGLRAASASGPEDVVRSLAADALAVLSDARLDAASREAALRALLTRHFDLGHVSRFALGKYWNAATAEERAEYRRLFEDYVMRFYVARLERYSGETLSIETVRLLGADRAVVTSDYKRSAGAPVRIDWRLRRSGEGWSIVDLVVEGVSLAMVRRSEFHALIRQNGGRIESLLAKLREVTA